MEKEYQELDFCLLIPCFNNKEGLLDSLSSVKYPINRFLIVIIDDGSEIPVRKEEIENALPEKLPLFIIRLQANKGITVALNTGLEWIEKHCQAKYIARLDCGDTCDPERFYLQVETMNKHPEIGLSGTWCIFEEKGTGYRYEYITPLTDRKIRRAMYFRNVFIHPTVIFKKDLIKDAGMYPIHFELVEDYAFFWRLSEISQTLVLDKFLVTCEINRNGISYKNKGKQLVARQRVIKIFGKNYLLKATAIIKLKLLFILPKRLLLFLKNFRG
jgi:glycosyltransferase involved in cell wall biosynthesis